ELTSLLAELRRTDDPETRRSLLETAARAQARLRELAQRLAEMATQVPSDFMNMEAMDATESEDALARLREAVDRGDLDEAESQLAALQRQIDALARSLGD